MGNQHEFDDEKVFDFLSRHHVPEVVRQAMTGLCDEHTTFAELDAETERVRAIGTRLRAESDALLDAALKRREARVRRALARQGYRLVKSRLRGRPTVDDCGGYMIVTEDNGVACGERFDLQLGDVEAFAREEAA